MNDTAQTEQPSHLRKAIKAAVAATVIGVITGVTCGLLLPPLGSMLLGAEAAVFFSNFQPAYMALFLGVSSAASSFYGSGLSSAVAAYH